jgi:LPS-assembly protein
VNSGHFVASYTPNPGSVFNLGYSFRRPLTSVFRQQVTEEAHLSAYFPLDNNWRFFAAINYSVEANTSVEDMAGLEYDTCCWKIRLLHLRYYENISGQVPDFDNPNLEREHSTQFQIVLKGMGGFGNRITGIMEDMIRGFEDSDY